MPCVSADTCKSLGGTCVEQCCYGCNCLLETSFFLLKHSYTLTGSGVALDLQVGVDFSKFCGRTALKSGSLKSFFNIDSCDEFDVDYWGNSLLISGEGKGRVKIYVDGSPAGEIDASGKFSLSAKWPGRKAKLKVCFSSAYDTLTYSVYGQDCPQQVPVDVEIYDSSGRLLYGVSRLVQQGSSCAWPLPSLMPCVRISTSVPPSPTYYVKIYRGGSLPTCRDLLLYSAVEIPEYKEKPTQALQIKSVAVNGVQVPSGGSVEVAGGRIDMTVRVSSSTAATGKVVVEAGSSPVVVNAVFARGDNDVPVSFQVYSGGRYSVSVYAEAEGAVSEKYLFTMSVRQPQCPYPSRCVPITTCANCIQSCDGGCCCVEEASPKFYIASVYPQDGTVVAYGETINFVVEVGNSGNAYGTAKVKSELGEKEVGVWPRSSASVKWTVSNLKPGTYTYTFSVYYGDKLHDSKSVTITVAHPSIQLEIVAPESVEARPAQQKTIEVEVRGSGGNGIVYLLGQNKSLGVPPQPISVPGKVSLSFTAPALAGEYIFYIVAVVGTQSATRPIRVVVVAEPEFRITSVTVSPLPCQLGNAYTQISVEASLANVGGGRGVAEVYADLADSRGYTFRVGVARVEVDSYKTASAFVGKASVPCPFSGKVHVYVVYNGARHDYREVPVEIKAYEPREESCVCVARELCQEGGKTCRLPDGREGVCCTKKPCTLFVKATGGAGRISVEIEG
ncbi:MAG: hypothetical protein ACPL3C_06465, partial [Pyrobaculum sp.]